MSGLTTRERDGYRWMPKEQAMTAVPEGHPITRAELREELQHYATKADLADLRGEVKAEFAGLRGWIGGATGVIVVAVALAAALVRLML